MELCIWSFVLSVSRKGIIEDLKNLEDLFDFSKLDEDHELFINRNKKIIRKLVKETPENFWIDEYICHRSEMYAFKFVVDNLNN